MYMNQPPVHMCMIVYNIMFIPMHVISMCVIVMSYCFIASENQSGKVWWQRFQTLLSLGIHTRIPSLYMLLITFLDLGPCSIMSFPITATFHPPSLSTYLRGILQSVCTVLCLYHITWRFVFTQNIVHILYLNIFQ